MRCFFIPQQRCCMIIVEPWQPGFDFTKRDQTSPEKLHSQQTKKTASKKNASQTEIKRTGDPIFSTSFGLSVTRNCKVDCNTKTTCSAIKNKASCCQSSSVSPWNCTSVHTEKKTCLLASSASHRPFSNKSWPLPSSFMLRQKDWEVQSPNVLKVSYLDLQTQND